MIEALLMLKASELGRLIQAVLKRQIGQDPPPLTGAEKYLLSLIRSIKIEMEDGDPVGE